MTYRINPRMWLIALTSLLVVLAMGIIFLRPAQAADIEVDFATDADGTLGTLDGDGNCSLREALSNANETVSPFQPYDDCDPGSAGADIINFSVGTVTLVSNIFVTTDVTLQGDVTISGGGITNMFVVASPGNGILRLNEVTLNNGFSSGAGGAILMNGGTLVCTDSHFENNSVEEVGGAIAGNGPLDINGCFFENNSAGTDGGAISINGPDAGTIEGTLFKGNQAGTDTSPGGGGGVGGAIYSSTALTIIGSAFDGNSADIQERTGTGGGAIHHASTIVQGMTITGSAFTGNSVIGDDGQGGAVFSNGSSPLTINYSHFGEIPLPISLPAPFDQLTPTDGNSVTGATSIGGAVYTNGPTNIVGSSFFGNSSTNHGGALSFGSNGDDINVANSTFSDNTASNNGGAVYTFRDDSLLTLTNVTIANNGAASGGGIYNDGDGDNGSIGFDEILLQNSIVYDNDGGDCAGGSVASADTDGIGNVFPAGQCANASGVNDSPNFSVPLPFPSIPSGISFVLSLGAGSGALGAGDAGICAAFPVLNTDQLGAPRPQGGDPCDAGAYESPLPNEPTETPTPTPSATFTSTNTPEPTFTPTATSALPPVTPVNITGIMTVAGTFTVGSLVTYTIILENDGTDDQADNAGDEFTDVLSAQLALVSANAPSGSTAIAANTVTWNGAIASGDSVTITITATINSGTEGQTVINQGQTFYDSDHDGVNDLLGLTDDPTVGGDADPTSFLVVGGDTATPTETLAATATSTETATSTSTLDATATSTSTLAATETSTNTPTSTLDATATSTETPTSTSTLDATETSTNTPTSTETPSSTSTVDATATSTFTATSSATIDVAATETPTASSTATTDPGATATSTFTATVDIAATETPTASATATTDPGATATSTSTATSSPTLVVVATETSTATASATSTVDPAATATSTPTASSTPDGTSTSTPTPSLTPLPSSGGGTPSPKVEVFLCDNLADQSDEAMIAFGGIGNVTRNGIYGNVFCRIIVKDSQVITNFAEIGVESVIQAGVIQSVDMFGLLPDGSPVVPFISPMTICLRGMGTQIFLSAADSMRIPLAIPVLANSPAGYSCGNIPVSGTVVLVRNGMTDAQPMPQTNTVTDPTSQSVALANCQVRTNNPVNFRSSPSTANAANIIEMLSFQTTLTATERIPGWFGVMRNGVFGWVSAEFVETIGSCG